ncbi:hypothetical protein ACHAXR_006383 [Thalassiosira sp. AJA248-18]
MKVAAGTEQHRYNVAEKKFNALQAPGALSLSTLTVMEVAAAHFTLCLDIICHNGGSGEVDYDNSSNHVNSSAGICLVQKGANAFISNKLFQLPKQRLHRTTSRIKKTLILDDNNSSDNHGSVDSYRMTSKILDEDEQSESSSIVFCTNVVVSRRTSLASAVGLASTALIPATPAKSATINNVGTSQIFPSTINNAINNYPKSTIPASLTIPLQYQPNLSAYTIAYKVGNSQFGAIIDTGSPFLLVPETSCKPDYRWGCFHPEESRPAVGLEPTLERFDGNEGLVEWREGKFSFDMGVNDEKDTSARKNSDSSLLLPSAAAAAANAKNVVEDDSLSSDTALQSLLFPQSLMTFGVISESLMDGPGGIFLGLVKNTDNRIRPSFLGQSDVSAFSVDLREREEGVAKTLTLYGSAAADADTITMSMEKKRKISLLSSSNKTENGRSSFNDKLTTQNAIPLVRDLNKKYGDPTIHYVGVASTITVNGSNLASTSRRNGKIYCIFDTGCSGMTISPSLFDERYATARAQREKSLWGTVQVELKTTSGETVTLDAKKPITTPLGSERPWGKTLDGHLIVLGLAFLEGCKMTVDIDHNHIWFED